MLMVLDAFNDTHELRKKNAPGRERKPVTSASNEGMTSGAAG